MTNATRSKVCTKCGEEKPLDDFHALRTAKDGRRTACKACAVAAATSWAARAKVQQKPAPQGDKRCTKCRSLKSRTEFHVRRNSTDGRASKCKPCAIAERRAYRAEHPDRVARTGKAWREGRPGYSAANAKAWREQNPERKLEYARRYDRENAERVAANKRAWYEANREWVLSWPERNPEANAAKLRRYRERHRDLVAERSRRRRVDKLGGLIEDVDLDTLWNGKCGICEEDLDASLRWPHSMSKSIDHIIPLSKGGTHQAANLQWAHLRCNIRKGARMPDSAVNRTSIATGGA